MDLWKRIIKFKLNQDLSNMRKLGRNELCHCGSGKKYKNCHRGMDDQKGSQNYRLIIGSIIIFIIILSIGIYWNQQTSGNTTSQDAPAGKVWSSEHGHWHDAD